MTRHQLAAPVALLAAVAVFFGAFAVTGGLIWPPVLSIAGAIGTYLMVDDRTDVAVATDDYDAEAARKVRDVLGRIAKIQRLARGVTAPRARRPLDAACRHVPELLDRVRRRSPTALYSTASQLGAHLTSLEGAISQYLDILARPELYRDPKALLRGGEDAFARFASFTLDSIRLVNQGDIAQYRANLETVAPPELPDPQ